MIFKKQTLLFIILLSPLLLFRCSQEKPKEVKPVQVKPVQEKPEAPKIEQKVTPLPVINYKLLVMDSTLQEFIQCINSDDSLKILYALNRTDGDHILRQDSLIVPDTFLVDLKLYSPFPESIQELKTIRKIIYFSYPAQAFAAYENGSLVRWGPVSMGKKSTPTDTGLFHTNWKAKQTTSTVDEEWIMNWYFNLDNFEGISMHEYALPGYPASHACMRMLTDDARWFYSWAEQWILKDEFQVAAYGTPVIIFGSYPFGKRRSWRKLAEDNQALAISNAALLAETSEFLPLLEEQQRQRVLLTDSLQQTLTAVQK